MKKFWQIENVLVFLKSIASSIGAGLSSSLILGLGMWLITQDRLIVGRIIQIVGLVTYGLFYGWYSRKWWGWK